MTDTALTTCDVCVVDDESGDAEEDTAFTEAIDVGIWLLYLSKYGY